MIDGKRVLAIIPARGGSKGIPRKNIRLLGGRPLIAWTIEEAKKSHYIDRLILSSDDAEIMDTARAFGCEVPFVRPGVLAQDETPGIDPVIHALNQLPGFDLVVLLQPTSPLRIVVDINACIEKCAREKTDSCVSVAEVSQSPHWMYKLDARERLIPLLNNPSPSSRRQDLPKVFVVNGAVYVAYCTFLIEKKTFISENTTAHAMPQDRSLDLDTELDFKLLEAILDGQTKSCP